MKFSKGGCIHTVQDRRKFRTMHGKKVISSFQVSFVKCIRCKLLLTKSYSASSSFFKNLSLGIVIAFQVQILLWFLVTFRVLKFNALRCLFTILFLLYCGLFLFMQNVYLYIGQSIFWRLFWEAAFFSFLDYLEFPFLVRLTVRHEYGERASCNSKDTLSPSHPSRDMDRNILMETMQGFIIADLQSKWSKSSIKLGTINKGWYGFWSWSIWILLQLFLYREFAILLRKFGKWPRYCNKSGLRANSGS